MIIRQLEEAQYDRFCSALLETGHTEPLEACYSVSLKVNNREYSVKIQPENDCNVAVLQAYEIERCRHGVDFTLIKKDRLLSSLLELLLYQGIG